MGSARILVVEDEIVVANQIQRELGRMGYHVCSLATSGREAITIAESERPDLVIMDIMLSEKMDGIETARHISSRYQIPVIYLSAYSDDDIVQRAKATEPFGYLIKPFRSKELQLNVEMALHKHRMEMQRDVLVRDIRDNVEQIDSLGKLLPACMYCKNVQYTDASWKKIEEYVYDHLNVKLSHGICPSCTNKFQPKKDGGDTDSQD
jgi:CheY-like chemotaxis protein